jgi:hypothetical protein
MRLFQGLIKFFKGTSIKFYPKFILDYGEYGGAMYSEGYVYVISTEKLYKRQPNGNFAYEKDMTLDEYINFFVNYASKCQPIDDLDTCFKLHDIDCNTTDFIKIVKLSHALPVNMGKVDPIFYLIYPFAVVYGIIYFTIFSRQPKELTVEQWDSLMKTREECRTKCSKEYGVEYI